MNPSISQDTAARFCRHSLRWRGKSAWHWLAALPLSEKAGYCTALKEISQAVDVNGRQLQFQRPKYLQKHQQQTLLPFHFASEQTAFIHQIKHRVYPLVLTHLPASRSSNRGSRKKDEVSPSPNSHGTLRERHQRQAHKMNPSIHTGFLKYTEPPGSNSASFLASLCQTEGFST